MAQAAFDGSETAAEGVKIEGTNVQQGAQQALEGTANTLDMKPKFGTNGLKNVNLDIDTFKDVRTQIWSQILTALIATTVAVFVISAAVKAGGFWGWLAAIGVAISTLILIAKPAFLFSKLSALKYTGGMNASWTIGLAIAAMAVMATAVALSFFNSFLSKAALKVLGPKFASSAAAVSSLGNTATSLTGGSGSSGGSSEGSSGGEGNPHPKGSQEWTEWENSH